MTAQDADLQQDRITLSGNRFRHIDMVLIDDFQYFAGRTALQEQLLQTLRALHQAGRTARDTQRTVLIRKRVRIPHVTTQVNISVRSGIPGL